MLIVQVEPTKPPTDALSKALEARNAAKAAQAAVTVQPLNRPLAPPRKKAPADPFIRKKPAKR